MISKQTLENLHLNENKSIYEIANILNSEHKIIRSYFNYYNIPYQFYKTDNDNFYKSYITPKEKSLLSKTSILAHSLYLCEGWHTQHTNYLSFVNTEIELVKIFVNCIHNIYQYNKPILLEIVYNFKCQESQIQCEKIINIFNDSQKYKFILHNDKDRKRTIIRTRCGGKNFARLFIDNAYYILSQST